MKFKSEIIIGHLSGNTPVSIALEIEPTNKPKVNYITAQTIPAGATNKVCFTGTMVDCGGQIDSEIRKLLRKGEITLLMPKYKVDYILQRWGMWHLNDMQEGTVSQIKAINDWKKSEQYNPKLTHSDVLQVQGLNPDRGVLYGYGGYILPLGDADLTKLVDIFTEQAEDFASGKRSLPNHPVVELLSKVTMTCKREGVTNGRETWTLTLSRGEVSESFEYRCGFKPSAGPDKLPKIQELLWCLVFDRRLDLEDICHGMSWVKVKKIETAIAEQNRKLERLFTVEELKLLEENTEALECQMLFN